VAFEAQEEANMLREIERLSGWKETFKIMAVVRNLGLYLILITFWIHYEQLNLTLYLGALGFAALYLSKYCGELLVRSTLAGHFPAYKLFDGDTESGGIQYVDG
jgi:hypothetical protein